MAKKSAEFNFFPKLKKILDRGLLGRGAFGMRSFWKGGCSNSSSSGVKGGCCAVGLLGLEDFWVVGLFIWGAFGWGTFGRGTFGRGLMSTSLHIMSIKQPKTKQTYD